MGSVAKFLRDCGAFFLLTLDGDAPAGRPFGAVMEQDGALYISTEDRKAVYRQLKRYPQMQIVALKPGTREWIRISGRAQECMDMAVKARMLEDCPALQKHFSAPDAQHYAVFRIDVVEVCWY